MTVNSINSVNPVKTTGFLKTLKESEVSYSNFYILNRNMMRVAFSAFGSHFAKEWFAIPLRSACKNMATESWFAELKKSMDNMSLPIPSLPNYEKINLECDLHAPDFSIFTRTGFVLTGVAVNALMKKIMGKEGVTLPFETALIVSGSYYFAGAGAPAAFALGLGSELIVRMPIVKKVAETTRKFVAEKMKTSVMPVVKMTVAKVDQFLAKADEFFTFAPNRLSGQKSQ